jgi:copper(I)-binding protein
MGFVLGAALTALAACQTVAPPAQSDLQITWLPAAEDQAVVRIVDASGAPVTDAVVSLEGNMDHAGMVPVQVEGVRDDADGAADGVYRLDFPFSMLGDWIMTVTVQRADGSSVRQDIDIQVTGSGSQAAGEAAAGLEIADARARPAPLAGGNGGLFLTVTNHTAAEERLLGGSSPAAAAVELHETVNDNGVMRMVPQPEGFAIPPGASLVLAPGGKHIMLINLAAPLAVGDVVTLTLQFAQAGEKVLYVPVVAMEGAGGEMPSSEQGHGMEMATPAPAD